MNISGSLTNTGALTGMRGRQLLLPQLLPEQVKVNWLVWDSVNHTESAIMDI